MNRAHAVELAMERPWRHASRQVVGTSALSRANDNGEAYAAFLATTDARVAQAPHRKDPLTLWPAQAQGDTGAAAA
jgi:hypothetical protein